MLLQRVPFIFFSSNLNDSIHTLLSFTIKACFSVPCCLLLLLNLCKLIVKTSQFHSQRLVLLLQLYADNRGLLPAVLGNYLFRDQSEFRFQVVIFIQNVIYLKAVQSHAIKMLCSQIFSFKLISFAWCILLSYICI